MPSDPLDGLIKCRTTLAMQAAFEAAAARRKRKPADLARILITEFLEHDATEEAQTRKGPLKTDSSRVDRIAEATAAAALNEFAAAPLLRPTPGDKPASPVHYRKASPRKKKRSPEP